MQKFGIDLSYHNNGINFNTLKNNGVEFAILRGGYTGYGDGVSKAKDTAFDTFYNQCKNLGIGVGVYWFSCANSYEKGKAEAEYLYNNCLKGRQFEYPIYIDVEDDTGGRKWLRNAGKEAITNGIIGFCETLEKLGYYVGIYANLDWFNNWINQDRVKNFDKWLASWSANKPNTYLSETMWQFGGETNRQRSPYLAGQIVDQNYCYIDYPSIIKNNGFNGYPRPTTNSQEAPKEPKKSIEQIAKEIIEDEGNKKFGTKDTNPTRKEILEKMGYDYQTVQSKVNELLEKNKKQDSAVYYTVKRGDNLTKIAKQYGVSISQIVNLNKISNPNLIFPNQKLRIK